MLPDEIPIRFTLRPKQLWVNPFVVVGGVVAFFLVPWSADAAPAWVQAVGSIGAILGAFAVANHQHTVAEQRDIAERKDKEKELAWRLAFLALEFKEVLENVVPDGWSLGVHEADQRAAFVFETMLSRINSNFDDDISRGRAALLYEIRVALAGLIFTLKSTHGIDPGDRDKNIAVYKRLSRELLEKCTKGAKEDH